MIWRCMTQQCWNEVRVGLLTAWMRTNQGSQSAAKEAVPYLMHHQWELHISHKTRHCQPALVVSTDWSQLTSVQWQQILEILSFKAWLSGHATHLLREASNHKEPSIVGLDFGLLVIMPLLEGLDLLDSFPPYLIGFNHCQTEAESFVCCST